MRGSLQSLSPPASSRLGSRRQLGRLSSLTLLRASGFLSLIVDVALMVRQAVNSQSAGVVCSVRGRQTKRWGWEGRRMRAPAPRRRIFLGGGALPTFRSGRTQQCVPPGSVKRPAPTCPVKMIALFSSSPSSVRQFYKPQFNYHYFDPNSINGCRRHFISSGSSLATFYQFCAHACLLGAEGAGCVQLHSGEPSIHFSVF